MARALKALWRSANSLSHSHGYLLAMTAVIAAMLAETFFEQTIFGSKIEQLHHLFWVLVGGVWGASSALEEEEASSAVTTPAEKGKA